MTERDLSNEPSTEGTPATEQPVVAGAGLTFNALDSDTPLSVGDEQDEESPAGASGNADPDAS